MIDHIEQFSKVLLHWKTYSLIYTSCICYTICAGIHCYGYLAYLLYCFLFLLLFVGFFIGNWCFWGLVQLLYLFYYILSGVHPIINLMLLPCLLLFTFLFLNCIIFDQFHHYINIFVLTLCIFLISYPFLDLLLLYLNFEPTSSIENKFLLIKANFESIYHPLSLTYLYDIPFYSHSLYFINCHS